MASPLRAGHGEQRVKTSSLVFNLSDAQKANPQSNFILESEDSSPSPIINRVRAAENCDNILFRSRDAPAPTYPD